MGEEEYSYGYLVTRKTKAFEMRETQVELRGDRFMQAHSYQERHAPGTCDAQWNAEVGDDCCIEKLRWSD